MPLVTWKFDDGGARRATAQLRRDVNREARRIAKEVAEKRAVPAARRYAPSLYRGRVRAGATNRAARVYIGGSVMQKRTAGWLEFGGAISAKATQARRVAWTSSRGKTVYTFDRSVTPYLVFAVDGRVVRVKTVRRRFVPTGRYVGRAMRSHTLKSACTVEVRDQVNQMLRARLHPVGVRVSAG